MALHRDIFWIGRQWAVTGHGMQLIDQRLEGAFDIEVIRLWDEDLIASLRAKAWLKADDFDKGLAVARTRHPRPSGAVPAPPAEPEGLENASPAATVPPMPQSPGLQMKTDGGAKFARPWRVWMKKT